MSGFAKMVMSTLILSILTGSVQSAAVRPKEMESVLAPAGNPVVSPFSSRMSAPIGIEATNDLEEAADTIVIGYPVRPAMYRRPWYDPYQGSRFFYDK